MAAILRARRILVLATGTAKAAAVAAMTAGPLTTTLPASWLQVHGAVDVLLDPAAAALEPTAAAVTAASEADPPPLASRSRSRGSMSSPMASRSRSCERRRRLSAFW